MTAISVPLKMLFLWTNGRVDLPKSQKTCLNPYSGPPKLTIIIQKHEISFSNGYYFGSYEKRIGNKFIISGDLEYYNLKNENFGVGLGHFRLRANAVHFYLFNICVTYTGKP